MNSRFIIFFLLFVSHQIRAVELKIKLFQGKEVSSFSFSGKQGQLLFTIDSSIINFPDTLKKFSVFIKNDSVLLKSEGTILGQYKELKISNNSVNAIQFDAVVNKKIISRCYEGSIKLTVFENKFVCINSVDIEKYVPGVIQAEVGKSNSLNFNKVKAIIVRTYSLSSLRKHELDGFNLCDAVHCQVYMGKCMVPDILTAVNETDGLVLVDTSLRLVSAAFHANCGGQTCNSEDVWSKKEDYLRSITDSFCVKLPDHQWIKKISVSEWLNYFQKKYKLAMTDSVKYLLTNFYQPQRKVYFMENPKIQLKIIREDFKLRSTWFDVKLDGDFVVLTGRGFGHGVGLCQQGAMQMSKKGYGYRKIVNYYYSNVILINYSQLEFFKDN